ncbi:MAG TPA: YceI family protein [Bryobacteraceae bacterium]|nr:YceI family protein [Bryobacteraceae bacterium]
MTAAPTAQPVRYDFDPAHSAAMFKVRHLMISNVKGEFTRMSGWVIFDSENPANCSIEATIDAASINTREPQRDEDLRSANFLDAARFPTITFKSRDVLASGGGTYEVTGDLTIHGVTQEVALAVEGVTPESKDPWGFLRRGASASVTIDRRDFGLVWNQALETGGVLIGDYVHISIDVELVRKAG